MRVGIGRLVLVAVCAAFVGWSGLTGCAQAAAADAKPPAAGQDANFYDRIMNILKSPPKLELPVPSPPITAERRETPIFGAPEVAKEQMVKYILRQNPLPRLNCSVEELVNIYYEEAGLEGVRPDLAIAQAILETGFFRYGGDVLPEQNNYAGIGTTGNSRGIWFSNVREGAIAHVQHLLAYATTREPLKPIVDPRYYIAREIHLAQCPTWESLSGKWAVPGFNYGQSILRILEQAKNV
ncbi:MAG: glucosaminidase domain-containing protein [Negativicutes bacterium]|nr:glucosaminidase domain-containing protein [Negativicutes bacterium]